MNGPNKQPPWRYRPRLRSFISNATIAVRKQKAWDGRSKSREKTPLGMPRISVSPLIFSPFPVFPYSSVFCFFPLRCVYLSRHSVASSSSLSLLKFPIASVPRLQSLEACRSSLSIFREEKFVPERKMKR